MPSRRLSLLFALASLAACEDTRVLVREVSPLNGSTFVDTAVQPRIELSGSAGVDATDRKVLLLDVTAGARLTVGGDVEVDGSTITYYPKSALRSAAEYVLEITPQAVTGDEFERVDGSEKPEEVLAATTTMLYRLHLSTRSCPRVRAAYHEARDGGSRITVRFSQKMSHTADKAVKVLDATLKSEIATSAAVWTDAEFLGLYLDTKQVLSPTEVYVLKVAGTAKAADNTGLDGNHNWKCGEAKDDFYMQFTGKQEVIFSRLQIHTPSTGP